MEPQLIDIEKLEKGCMYHVRMSLPPHRETLQHLVDMANTHDLQLLITSTACTFTEFKKSFSNLPPEQKEELLRILQDRTEEEPF